MSVYRFEQGLRKVTPYYLTFNTHVKPRWIGRTITDIFSSEFGDSCEAIKEDITNELIFVRSEYGRKNGDIVVKGWETLSERKLDRFDIICNSKHMHEPSVPEGPASESDKNNADVKTRLKIIYEDDDLLVIDKPSGVPTHPTGNYYYNSVTEILKHDLEMENVWPFHRLDKVTSGVLILGKSKEAVKAYSPIFQEARDQITKEYLARVEGNFPNSEFMVNCPIFSVNSTGGYIKPLNADMLPANSTTVFKKLAYNAEINQSIVSCRPLTGRMHQIRIHLRNIGHPIANDYLYNPINERLHNQKINQINGAIEISLYKRIFTRYPEFNQQQKVNLSVAKRNDCIDLFALTNFKNDHIIQEQLQELRGLRQESLNKLKSAHNITCDICKRRMFDTNKDMSDSEIWLHAHRYEYSGGNSFSYQTAFPDWCNI
ncbi:DRAP deaminase and pseudouridylate synthase [Scheffersomyces xylosifermentans]|uniref:DRAP deaminase and pseudouridylate synthase n=1 Tax=Scheffersomyces xylosifermentans TaxID=1304137 RepID=UPI00315C7EA7